MKITKRMAVRLLDQQKSKNTIFRVEFIKRTNGEYRVMRGRYNVTRYLKGGALKFDPKQKNLSIVFDMDKREYRSINLEMIKKLRLNGTSYTVTK